jgi:hypothetical protein
MSVVLTRFTTLPAMYKIVGDKSDMKNAAVHGSNGPILLGAEIGGRCLRRTGTGRSTGLVPNPTQRPVLMVTENTSKRVPRGILFGKKTKTPPVMGPK